MSDVIFSNKLVPPKHSEQKNQEKKYQKYLAIPVSIIKVMFLIKEKQELNHFERAVISLLLKKSYTVDELSDLLLLKKDLIDLIIHDLNTNGFIDHKSQVTPKGEEAIKNIYSSLKQENCYLFFDHNRSCLLSSYCNDNDITIVEGRYNDGNHSFTLENDAFKEEISYGLINIQKNKECFSEEIIKKIVERDIFRKSDIENIVNVEVLECNPKKYHFVTMIETYSNYQGTKWSIKNPITLENDDGLYEYIYDNSTNEQIKKILTDIMQYRLNSQGSNETNKMYEMIQKRLFSKEIKTAHEDFILPLISVIQSLNDSSNQNYSDRIYRNEVIKNAMVNLGDLYENVLYQVAILNKNKNNIDILSKNIDDNKIILVGMAKAYGFDVSINAEKLLCVSKKSIKRLISDPNKAKLGDCLAWNLIIDSNEQDSFLSKLSKKYPNFINLMYQFKHYYRDESKHSVSVSEVSPKIYIDILFDILQYAFGYVVNKQVLDKLIHFNETICDYSFSEELLRTELGNKIFSSNNDELTEIKFNLLAMYESFITENCNYLMHANSLLENSIKLIVRSIRSKYKCKHTKISDLFDSKDALKEFLEEKGFTLTSRKDVDNSVMDSLDFIGIEHHIEQGFRDNFKSSVLRVNMLSLILMIKQNEIISKEFIDFGLNELFVITSTFSYLQGHQQVQVFNNKHAAIIVESTKKMIDFIVNKSELIKW